MSVPTWLERARVAADQPPLRARRPLRLATPARHERVGSIEADVARGLVDAGLPITAFGDGYLIAAPVDPSLAAVARWLHEHGLAAPWRGELLAVCGEHGQSLARIERAVVRVLGIATEAVHLVGTVDAGAVWVQQRAFDKATDPGRWDTLMGGQVAAGESIATTLARETMEEAGLAIADLRELTQVAPLMIRRPVAEGYLVERIEVFRAVVPEGLVPINRDGEVVRFDCLEEDVLEARLAGDEFTLEATLILGAELERRRAAR